MPAMLCTTMPPAKSSTPHFASSPPPHTMCTNGKYTNSSQSVRKMKYALRHPVRERPGDERRRDDREHHLVGDVHDERNAVVGRGGHEIDAAHERHVEVADHAPDVAREAERIAAHEPHHGRPTERDEALDHDREHVLAADEPAVEEREPGRHEHHQAAAEQHERGIAGVESKHGGASSIGTAPPCPGCAWTRRTGRPT